MLTAWVGNWEARRFWRGSWNSGCVCCHSEHRAESHWASAGDAGNQTAYREQWWGQKDRGQALQQRSWVRRDWRCSERHKGNRERRLTFYSKHKHKRGCLSGALMKQKPKSVRTWMGGNLCFCLGNIKLKGKDKDTTRYLGSWVDCQSITQTDTSIIAVLSTN